MAAPRAARNAGLALALVLAPLGAAHAACPGGGASPLTMPSVAPLRAYHAGLHAPARLAPGADGRLWVSDPARGEVFARAADGRVVARQAGLGRPISVATAADGRLYVGDLERGRVTAYGPGFTPLHALGGGDWEFLLPSDIAVDPASGRVYVADGQADQVVVYDEGGARLFAFGGAGAGDGQFIAPVALHIAGDELLVSDQINFRIQFFGLDGSYRGCIGTPSTGGGFGVPRYTRQFNLPQGLWADAAGRIYVADAQFGVIRVVDRDGASVGQLGGYGSGPGQLRVPGDLAIDAHGRLFVASANNARLEVYGLGAYEDPERVVPAQLVLDPVVFQRSAVEGIAVAYVEIPGQQLSAVDGTSVALNGVPVLALGFADIDNDAVGELRVEVDLPSLVGTLPDGDATVIASGLLASGLSFEAAASVRVAGSGGDCVFTPPASARGREQGQVPGADRTLRGNPAAVEQRPDLFCGERP